MRLNDKNSSQPCITGFVDNHKVSILIDTGSNVSLIKENLIQKQNNIRKMKLNAPVLTDVNGNKIDTLGIYEIPIKLCEKVFHNKFIVVPNEINFPTDMLMGMDIMRTNNMILNMCENFVTIKDKSTPIQTISSIVEEQDRIKIIRNINLKTKEGRVIKIRADNDLIIPPNSARIIHAHAKGVRDENLLMKPHCQFNSNVSESLIFVNSSSKMDILYVNSEDISRRIDKNLVLGTAIPTDVALLGESEIFGDDRVLAVEKSEINLTKVCEEIDSLVNCEKDVKTQLLPTLAKYRDILAIPGEQLGQTHLIELALKLKEGTKPIALAPYKIPHSKELKLEAEIDRLLKQGTIAPTNSPWSFPVVIVAKPDDSIRLCVDYRKLNEVTESDNYPLPVIEDLLMGLGDSKIFTQLDLVQAYHQVPLSEETRPMTAFSIKRGHYEFQSAPYGIKQMPAVFQRLMNNLFPNHKNVTTYLDDLLIHSKNIEEHFQHLEEVLTKLREAGLKVKLKKCSFCQSSVRYLGYELTDKGFKPLNDKVAAINKFPIPNKEDDVRSFLGMAGYYRKYIDNFSTIAQPLSNLLKKDVPFCWTNECENSFKKLKDKLSAAPVLTYPNFKLPFFIETDASQKGIGAVLSQKDEKGGKLKPIAFASRLLKSAENNYSVTEKEALAVVWALRKFRYTVYGYPVTVITDHQPLVSLFTRTLPPGRLGRWALLIQEFGIKIKYKPGCLNYVPDALSRYPIEAEETIQEDSTVLLIDTHGVKAKQPVQAWSLEELKAAQSTDENIIAIRTYLENGEKGKQPILPTGCTIDQFKVHQDIVYHTKEGTSTRTGTQTIRLLVPEKLVPNLLNLYHNSTIIGHRGIDHTVHRINTLYVVFNLKQKVEEYVTNCVKCIEHRMNPRKPAPISKYEVIPRPFHSMHMDILGPFPVTREGYKYIIVYVDRFSRYTLIDKLKDRTAQSVAASLVNKVITEYSTPSVLISDNALEFTSAIVSELCKLFKIKKTEIIAYHPAANGLAESANKRILNALRVAVNKDQRNWSELLPLIQMALNTAYHDAIGDTPHFLVFLQDKITPIDLFFNEVGENEPHDYLKEMKARQKLVYRVVQENLINSQNRYTGKYNNKSKIYPIKEGGRIYLKTRVPPKLCRKLYPKYEGPYRVLKDLGAQRFLVKNLITSKEKKVHADQTKILAESFVFPAQNRQVKLPFPNLKEPSLPYDENLEDDDMNEVAARVTLYPLIPEVENIQCHPPPPVPRYTLRARNTPVHYKE